MRKIWARRRSLLSFSFNYRNNFNYLNGDFLLDLLLFKINFLNFSNSFRVRNIILQNYCNYEYWVQYYSVLVCIVRRPYEYYSMNIIPVIGELVASDWHAYRYLVESIRRFPTPVCFHSSVIVAFAISGIPLEFYRTDKTRHKLINVLKRQKQNFKRT